MSVYLKWLNETGLNELELVGGKNASLGEMLQNLTLLNINVPFGFIITSHAYDYFMSINNLYENIQSIINETDTDNLAELQNNGLKIRNLIIDGKMPPLLCDQIIDYYNILSSKYGELSTDVAVRSSGTAEDLPDASFAGQQDTYLNVSGNDDILKKIKDCFASLYTDRAICYRKTLGFVAPIKISVCVQKMVRSDLGCSGVAFSLDPDSGFRDLVCINGSWGLGEMVVSGQIKPDEFLVFKTILNKKQDFNTNINFNPIIDKHLGDKNNKMVYDTEGNNRTKIVTVDALKQDCFCLDDTQILQLARSIIHIESFYNKKYGRWCPVDVEWALDGVTNELYIVQARPETIHSRKSNENKYIEYKLLETGKELCNGVAVGSSIGSGRIKIITSLNSVESNEFQEGDVLVTEYTDPTFEPLMKKAGAIITDKGGRTSHAAIVSRELGKTAIVGCGNATEVLKNNVIITACCSNGETGRVYEGNLKYKTSEYNISELPSLDHLHSKLMLNIGNPECVFKHAYLPVSGVGLAREEFIIANTIGIHPNAIINIDTIPQEIRSEIEIRSRGFNSPREFYIKRLVYGIARIGAAFYPKPVIVRFSDFKSNEYKDLLGGSLYEPNEENPMLGFRGCSRYYSSEFKESFQLECEAIRYVRETIGLTNVIVMLPFCRTIEECKNTLETMKDFGLERGKNDLQVFLMCEIPSNVILADEFCKYVDGFSIGSNDLTQLCLGLDRDAGQLAHIGNENNEAVKRMIRSAIRACKKHGVKIGICGQGPSDLPEFAKFLLQEEIDTISLVPDSIFKTTVSFGNIKQNSIANNCLIDAITARY
jgi:pyruvate,water dikinase